LLTIKYQELSEKGIPRFLSGKSIRDGYWWNPFVMDTDKI
jgi:hypothetical protein